MKIRYTCFVNLDNTTACFKRYGESQEQVTTELSDFIKEFYDVNFDIVSVQPDKTHPVTTQEEIPQSANANEHDTN